MEYTEDQLTDFRTTKPEIDGVYQTMAAWSKRIGYQKFERGYWYTWRTTAEEAATSTSKAASNFQNDPWRGLSSGPSSTKKRAGNKRKTMYVVMDKMEIDKPLGCFMCEIVARNFASKFKWAEVEKIRFRTPEA